MNKQIDEMANDYYEAMLKARGTLGSMNEGAPKWYAKELYAKGYRKASDVATEILDDIMDALTGESIEEEKKANSALEAQDTISYDIFSYANDKLETLLTALGIFKKLYLKKYESEGEDEAKAN